MTVAQTIRQQILTNLYAILPAMRADGNPVWNLVTKEKDLSSVSVVEMPAVAIEEGDEHKVALMFPVTDKVLRIFVFFRFQPLKGADVYDTYNYYLGLLLKAILADHTIGGTALDIQEAGNTPEIADRLDTRPGGVLMLDIHYRHRTNDPYTGING